MKKRVIRYSVTCGVGLVIAFVIASLTGLYAPENTEALMKTLCDACFFTAIALTGSGLLVMCANAGTFDIFAYGGKRVLSFFIPMGKAGMQKQNYYEYKESKHKSKTKYAHLLIVGAFFLVLSLIFLGAYYGAA